MRSRTLAVAGLIALAAGLAVETSPGGAGAITRPDVVRVGGPSHPNDAKIAVVAASTPLAGRPFTVVDANGTTVLSGTLVRAKRPQPWRYAATADLSAITTPGSYRVRTGTMESRPWVVRESGASDAIAVMLGFFAANRDGNEPSPIHGPSHLNDAVVSGGAYDGATFDLTGGWMDAGDMLHFTETTAYSTVVLQVAAAIDPADAAALENESDVGVRWLLKAHPAPGLFIGQVGDVRDHEQGWRNPAVDDASTVVGIGTRFAYPTDGSQIAGKTAAALALAAQRSSGTTRAQLIAEAQAWYSMGVATAGPGAALPGGFYRDLTWQDDLALGALELWRATGDSAYHADAIAYLSQVTTNELSWNSVGPLVGADLCGGLGHPATPDPAARTLGCNALVAAAQGALDNATINAPWGTPGWFSWGQTGLNGAEGAVASLAQRAGVANTRGVATRARDWLFGENPWEASFVVGYANNSPQHPHHWANPMGDGLPVGAVVGGPASRSDNRREHFVFKGPFDAGRAAYQDVLDNYVTNEPAIDYTADSILLLASLAS